MTNVKALLEKNPAISAWRINETATQSYELFFVHRQLETVRATDTLTTSVTIYVDHDGFRGDSAFTVSPALTEDEVEEKIAAAVERARLISNPPFDLPPADETDEENPTNMASQDMKTLARRIADAVFAADDVPGGSINACEIFLYRDVRRVENSRGVRKAQTVHRVMIEAIPTFTGNEQSVELYEDHRFTEFDPAKVTAEIRRRMQEVRDRYNAQRPQTPLTVNVLLRPQEIARLMGEISWALNYSAVYSHANPFGLGDDLQPGALGDRITLFKKARIPGSDRSAFFDADGLALSDVCLIQQGVVKNYFGSHRFGQYLGVAAPTGDLPCTYLQPGSMTEQEMKAAPYLECASLSGLQVDLYSDYIGGEIRLAYYFDGQSTVPVTGITMSAKLSDVLKALRFSREETAQGAYQGPALLLMPRVAVL